MKQIEIIFLNWILKLFNDYNIDFKKNGGI
jgi:hypothetical protein